ncbi:hypothetical protein ACOKM5_05415 [Streptomyces sp. BH097]|uniref:hypothetical protein n=1 Tax=unclassified Streptomyces TaxID=2593676 RepID=UPI003BB6842E
MTSTVRETTREAVLDAGRGLGVPDPVTESFLRHLRPCVHLCAYDMVPEAQRQGARPVGRAAGPARLPKDLEAPEGLPHILTLDCAAIPADSLDIDFPADGHLVVFAEISDYPGEGAVIHLPPGEAGAAEHPLREVEGTAGPDFHDPFPLYAVPGATMPDFQRWSDVAEAAEYAGEDAERRRLVDRLIGKIDAVLYPRWTHDIQLGGHSRAWQNPVEDRGDVLFLRIPASAVCEEDAYLTLIAGRRERIAERRYDDLEFEVEL